MNKKYDLTGMRFGTLAVTGFNGRDKDGHLQWNCLCDCGNRSVVNGTALRNGSVKACKCIRQKMECQYGSVNATAEMLQMFP